MNTVVFLERATKYIKDNMVKLSQIHALKKSAKSKLKEEIRLKPSD